MKIIRTRSGLTRTPVKINDKIKSFTFNSLKYITYRIFDRCSYKIELFWKLIEFCWVTASVHKLAYSTTPLKAYFWWIPNKKFNSYKIRNKLRKNNQKDESGNCLDNLPSLTNTVIDNLELNSAGRNSHTFSPCEVKINQQMVFPMILTR